MRVLTPNYKFASVIVALTCLAPPVCPQIRKSTSLAVSAATIQLGSATRLEATVSPIESGKIYFLDGATLLGIGTVDASGKAAITTTLRTSGPRQLRAIFEGPALTSTSASPSVPVMVAARPTADFSAPADYSTGGPADFIAVGDLNNDGHADLVVVNQTNSVSVLLGNADGSFQPAMNYPVGTAPKAVAIGDFNGDGNMDLAVSNSGSGTLSILLGQGDGSFRNAISVPVKESPFAIAAGDLNGDGKEDLVVSSDTGNNVSVLLGNGDATFQPARVFPTGAQPRSIAIADFNSDGRPDLAVANAGGNSVTVLLGNGDGSFESATFLPLSVGIHPASIAAGDFNGDGQVDLAVANTGSNGVTVLLGQGDGTFRTGASYAATGEPVSISLIDFNGDGVPDLLVIGRSGDISLFLGGGDGTFQLAGKFAGGAQSSAVVVADFSGDGRADIAVSSAATNAGATSTRVLLAAAPTTTTLTAAPNPSVLSDLVTFTATVSPPSATGTVTFVSGASPIGTALLAAGQAVFRTTLLPAGTNVIRATYGGDAKNAASMSAPVFDAVNAARTPGFSSPAKTFAADRSASAVAIGDFNGDGIPDLAVTNPGSSDVSILLGRGDGTFPLANNYPAIAGAGPLAVADFNGDGAPDVLVGSLTSGAVVVLPGGGNGTLLAALTTPVPGALAVSSIAVADFNLDGKPDVVLATGANNIVVLLGKGDGTFQAPNLVPSVTGIAAVTVADVNNDGIPDVVVPGFVFLGKGDGTFLSPLAFSPGGSGAVAITAGDFNGDGNVDLVIANTSSAGVCDISVVLGNGTGAFGSPVCKGLSAIPRSIAVGDFNGDGHLDIAAANSNSSVATWLLGKGDGTFPLAGSLALPATAGTPLTSQTLAVGDFNTDGRTDVAIAAFDKVTILLGIGSAPAAIVVVAGSPQSADVGKTFTIPLQAMVLDNQKKPMRGVAVTFTVQPAGGASGTFASGGTVIQVVTDSSGTATAVLAANTTAGGPYTVTATVAGVAAPAQFQLTNTPGIGPPASITFQQTGALAATVGTTLQGLVAAVVDAKNNPIAGVMVTFSVTPSANGASAIFADGSSSATVSTDSRGLATAPPLKANTKAGGTYTIKASVAGFGNQSSVQLQSSLQLSNAPGLPASVTPIAGNPQVADVTRTFPAQFQVTSQDAFGNPVIGGTQVKFTAVPSATGASGTFAGPVVGTAVTVNTNDSGTATAPAFTANGTAGQYSVTATALNNQAATTTFTLKNLAQFDTLPDTVTFDYVAGGQVPSPKGLAVTSGFHPLPITVTGGAGWLNVSPQAGTTPQTIVLSVNPTGFTPNQYVTTVTLDSPFASNGPKTVNVVLNVTAQLTASAGAASFSYVAGQGTPPTQQFSVTSGSGIAFTVSAADQFVKASVVAGVTPGQVSIGVDPTGLVPGDYTSTVKITPNASQAMGTSIAVKLTVRAPLTVSPGTIPAMSAFVGITQKSTQTLSVASGGLPVNYSVTISGASCFSVDKTSGTTPGAITLSIDSTGLAAGTTSASLTISSPFTVPTSQVVPLSLILTAAGVLTIDQPNDFAFPAPASGKAIIQPFGLASSTGAPLPFTVTTTGSFITASQTSGTTPATVTATIDPTNLPPGKSVGSITFTSTNDQKSITRNITLTVPSPTPKLDVSPPLLQFQVQKGQSASGQLLIQNIGTGNKLQFNVAPDPRSASWLGIAPGTGTLDTPNAVTGAQINVDSRSLPPGSYFTFVNVTLASVPPQQQQIGISVVVSPVAPMIDLDFSGFTINVRRGQGSNVSQDVAILDSGDQPFNWQATIISGASFVSIDPGMESGVSSKNSPGKLTIRPRKDFTTSSTTQPGSYSATVQISSPGAANSPRLFTVVLNVTDPGQVNATPFPQPTGLVFVVQQGSDPSPQTVKVSTSSQVPVVFQANTATYTGPDQDAGKPVAWLDQKITNGNASTDNPGSVDAIVHSAGLPLGIFTGGLNISIGIAVRTVNITLVVIQSPAGGGKSPRVLDAVAGCTPQKLIPTFVGGLVNNFSAQVGGPVPITVKVIDDCGNLIPDPAVSGSPKADVTIQFSTGDPSAKTMLLTDTKNAGYTITWIPDASSSTTTVTVQAKLGNLAGTLETNHAGSAPAPAADAAAAPVGIPAKVTGQVAPSQTPVLIQNGTLNNFNPQRGAPLAPGTSVEIFGANLIAGDDSMTAQSLPLPTSLGGTRVIIGGIAAPLYYASKTQINAQVPFELAPGSYQIQIDVNGALTVADQINVVPVTPGLLAASDSDKTVIAQHVNGDLVSGDNPAQPGETITLYLVGMGLTTPSVASGAASPADPLALVQAAVLLDDTPVNDIQFAGLAPSAVGLYQINFKVPDDTPLGKRTLTVTQQDPTTHADVISNAATLPVGPASN